MGGLKPDTQGPQGGNRRDEGGSNLGEFAGRVDSVGPKFGFIQCNTLKKMGHEDVYVPRDQLKNFKKDDIVSFTAYVNSKWAQPQGKNLKPKAGGKSDNAGSKKGNADNTRDEAGGELGEYKGVIENKSHKYGFIKCKKLEGEGYDKVFVLGNEFKNYQHGQTVKFTAYLDSNGRCQGKDLKSGLKK